MKIPKLIIICTRINKGPTRGFVVLKRDDKSWSLLEPFQEVDDKVANILRIGGLKGELLTPHRHQGERLGEGLAAPRVNI